MPLLSYFGRHIFRFGNVFMYSMEIGELANMTHIKNGWRQTNKSQGARQTAHSYGRQHAIRRPLVNLESLPCHDADFRGHTSHDLHKTASTVTAAASVVCKRVLKGDWEDLSNVMDFRVISQISLKSTYPNLIRYSRDNLPVAAVFLPNI